MKTLREQVLIALREKILSGKLKLGQRLVERDLASELGVSRTPVRECFPVLERQGLVQTTPGLGVIVRNISSKEVQESLEVRNALDAMAIRKAAHYSTEEDWIKLESMLELHELAVKSGDEERMAEADSNFHHCIYQAAGNSVLCIVRDSFALYESFYFNTDFYNYTLQAFNLSLKRHRAMLKAIKQRDPDKAEEASRKHIQDTIQLLKKTNNEK